MPGVVTIVDIPNIGAGEVSIAYCINYFDHNYNSGNKPMFVLYSSAYRRMIMKAVGLLLTSQHTQDNLYQRWHLTPGMHILTMKMFSLLMPLSGITQYLFVQTFYSHS